MKYGRYRFLPNLSPLLFDRKMSANKKIKYQDPLRQLLEAAESKVLIDLIEDLALMLPEVRRECFEYLKSHVKLSPGQQETSDCETIFALWGELEPDLEELDDYGGGDYELVDSVSDLLDEIVQKLTKNTVPLDCRKDLLNEVLPYLQSSNAGLDDELYSVAYACCYDNEDLRRLAVAFEKIGSDWSIENALLTPTLKLKRRQVTQKYQPLIDLDFIYPTGGGDQLDSGIIFFLELSFQPGSTRFIISRCTIFYGNFHQLLPD